MVHPRDVGEAAAAALLDPGHAGRAHVLTGPEAVSYAEAAARLGAILGKPVEYLDIPADALRGALAAAGLPGWLVEGIVEIQAQARAGIGATPTGGVEALTGHPPRDLDAFLRERAAAFA
ncbi:NAD(P)H azoreductase [compost metagenome]